VVLTSGGPVSTPLLTHTQGVILEALDYLEHASSHIKQIILRACAYTVSSDKNLSDQKRKLIRATLDALDANP